MGVIYSYYDSKNHSEFDMGKWYSWDCDEFGSKLIGMATGRNDNHIALLG